MEAENGVMQPQTKESLEPPVEEEGLPGATSERGEEYLEPPVEEVRNTWSHQWKRHRSSLGAFEGNMVQLISWKKKFLLLSLWLFGMDTLGN